MSKTLSVGVLALVVIASVFGLLVARTKHEEMQTLLVQLRSDDINQRENAAKALLARKQDVLKNPGAIIQIENIVREFADNEQRRGTAKTAIGLLGDLQSSGSIPLLVDHLTLRVFYKETKRIQPKEDLFPSVGALIKIGQPSVDPVLSRAEGTDDEQIGQCAAYVVTRVLKDDAAPFVQDRIAHQTDPRGRQRLLVVQKYIAN